MTQKLVVIIPTIPKYNSHEQHYGANGEEGKRISQNMVLTDKEILDQAKEVLKCLEKSVKNPNERSKGKKLEPYLYPQVIYLGATADQEAKHRLQDIGDGLTAINFVIVAHGDSQNIGTSAYHDKIDPSLLAELFDHYFSGQSEKMEQINFSELPMSFEFQSCNSAYFPIQDSHQEEMRRGSQENVAEDFKKNSYIGKFHSEMQSAGYESINVSGYRGYKATRKTLFR